MKRTKPLFAMSFASYDVERRTKKLDLISFIAEKKRYAMEARNPKGYLISCIKTELEKINNNKNIPDISKQNTISVEHPKDLLSDLTKKFNINK